MRLKPKVQFAHCVIQGEKKQFIIFWPSVLFYQNFELNCFKKKSFQENEFADIIKGEQWMKTDYFPDLPSEI